METMIEVEHIIAAVIATVALLIYYHAPTWLFGADAIFWNPIRRAIVPIIDQFLKNNSAVPDSIDYASYELKQSEYVETVDMTIDEVNELLANAEFRRMPLAALKTLPDGRVERASWALRNGLLATTQTHVMLFEAENGVDIYAHVEPNAINPFTAWKHYTGQGYDPEAGADIVRSILSESKQ